MQATAERSLRPSRGMPVELAAVPDAGRRARHSVAEPGPANSLDIEPDVIRLFGAADIGRRGMGPGWADPEDGHAWNDGHETTLTLSAFADRLPQHARLVVEGEPYVTRQRPVQDVMLFANGWMASFWRMTAREEVALSAVIDPEWWRIQGSRAVLRLTFHIPNCVRPIDIGDGQDGRRLGFCFRTICLRSADVMEA